MNVNGIISDRVSVERRAPNLGAVLQYNLCCLFVRQDLIFAQIRAQMFDTRVVAAVPGTHKVF